MYAIELIADAVADLGRLRKFDQVRLTDAIESQLTNEPVLETRNRKRLRRHKDGNDLYIRGERFEL